MNQFVNQLMLGQALYGSTGAPSYDPVWGSAPSWFFAAQYFMEIYPNGTAKAASGPFYNCSQRDILWTEYALSEDWAWTLSMGVVGDAARTSTLRVEQPFMGMLAPETSSWSEPAYGVAHYNGCWELYGVAPYGGTHYPSGSSSYDLRTVLGPGQAEPAWQQVWTNIETASCPRHPNASFAEIHNQTQQDVLWNIYFEGG